MGNSSFGRRELLAALTAWGAMGAGPSLALTPLAPSCPTERVTITGDFGEAAFNIDVADDEPTRAQGLMHVPQMPLSSGMLFVYQKPQPLSFWMRNTLIELDMLFVDGFGEIKHIHHRAQPGDETVISPGKIPLIGVLEINGGLAKRLGIQEGDVLRHPAFVSREQPWNCAE